MFKQGDFTRTPGDLEKRRKIIQSMLPQFGSANYAGEGLAHLLSGLVGGKRMRALDKQEAAQRKRADGLFADMGLSQGMLDPWFTPSQAAAIKEARKKK